MPSWRPSTWSKRPAVLLDSVDVQLALAEVAEERGELDRAEKAYRALLVLARRGTAAIPHDRGRGAGAPAPARAQAGPDGPGQGAPGIRQCAGLADPVEARRIQAALLGDGDSETLLDLLGKRQAAAATSNDEALVVCERASVLEKIGRADEGLAAVLDSWPRCRTAPKPTPCPRIAVRLSKAEAYLDAVAGAADKLRRADDAATLADLLLRASDVAEKDLHLLDRALAYLRRAEQSNRRSAEVPKRAGPRGRAGG